MKRRTERGAALFWLAVGVFFAVGGVMLKPGTPRNPGPGFLPLIMALLLIAFTLVVLAGGGGCTGAVNRMRWTRHALLVGSVFAYGAILDLAGFLFSTFLLMAALFALFLTGEHRWQRVLLYAAMTAMVGWLVFSVTLKVPFPQARLMVLSR